MLWALVGWMVVAADPAPPVGSWLVADRANRAEEINAPLMQRAPLVYGAPSADDPIHHRVGAAYDALRAAYPQCRFEALSVEFAVASDGQGHTVAFLTDRAFVRNPLAPRPDNGCPVWASVRLPETGGAEVLMLPDEPEPMLVPTRPELPGGPAR